MKKFTVLTGLLLFVTTTTWSGCKRRSEVARKTAITTAGFQHDCDDIREISSHAVEMLYKLDVCGTIRKYKCSFNYWEHGKYLPKCSEIGGAQ